MSPTPAVLAGVAVALYITKTTLNIQSFMGTIMAVGVAVANAILLVTFAEKARQTGAGAAYGARTGSEERLRAILMTSGAMIVGMIPMALGLGQGGEQSAPMGRAVIGGLLAATVSTLLVLPAVFAVVMGSNKIGSSSLHPDDPDGTCYAPETAGASHAHGPAVETGLVPASHSEQFAPLERTPVTEPPALAGGDRPPVGDGRPNHTSSPSSGESQ